MKQRALWTLLLCALPWFAAARVEAQPACRCTVTAGFGTCVTSPLDAAQRFPANFAGNYPGEFPGSAVVVPSGAQQNLFVADLYTGFTYSYDATDVGRGALRTLLSPRGSGVTSGISFFPGENATDPADDELFWAIDGDLVRTDVARGAADTAFRELDPSGAPPRTVALRNLAQLVLGDTKAEGTLGGLTYHAGRGTFWAVDIVNDIYFEITPDGSLVLEDGVPVHFFNPLRDPHGAGAYGNSIAYVRSGGREYFDILVGSVADGRPVRVARVHAPADPAAANVAIGADTGLRYPVAPDLVWPAVRSTAFPTGIAYLEDSCTSGQSSEYLLIFDTRGISPAVLAVSAEDPVAGVADFTCTQGQSASVEISWRNTRGYTKLAILRRNLVDPAASGEEPVTELDFVPDPDTGVVTPATGSFIDTTLPLPPDGTYEYIARATARVGTSDIRAESRCIVTVGRGALIRSVPFATAEGSEGPPHPLGVTRTAEHLYVVNAASGIAQRFLLDTLAPDGTVTGPFAPNAGAWTTGLAFHEPDGRLFWLARFDGRSLLQSTLLDGSAAGIRQVVQLPPSLLRSADYGDLVFDGAGDRFWLADRRHGLIHACRADGRYIPDSTILRPDGATVLGGGLELVAADATGLTLDVTLGYSATVDRLARLRFERGMLGSSEVIHRVELRRTLNVAQLGSTTHRVLEPGTQNEALLQLVVGTDTERIYELDMNAAVLSGLPFVRGDANNDGALNISDPSFILSFLFLADPTRPACEDAADTDDNGEVQITDAIALFEYLFRAGATPALPFPDCGFELTKSALECKATFCADGAGQGAA